MLDPSFPKITVVTPNYNQGRFLEQTIRSVLDQHYPNLEYIIIDGGSTDGSVEIIKKHEDKLYYWVSEPDKGMYDAINKGFVASSGEIMCWINSDDVLWDGALHYVGSLFSSHTNIHWLQGWPSVINEEGNIVFKRQPVYSKFYFYLKKYTGRLEFIQQESTFWTRAIWEKEGGTMNLNYSLAADFDLWMRFFRTEKLYCTRTQLAAFRQRAGQQSANIQLYLKEAGESVSINSKQLNAKDKFLLSLLNYVGKCIYQYKNKRLTFLYNKLVSAICDKPKFV